MGLGAVLSVKGMDVSPVHGVRLFFLWNVQNFLLVLCELVFVSFTSCRIFAISSKVCVYCEIRC